MDAFNFSQLITRDDIVRGGACYTSVCDWAIKNADTLTAMPLRVALRIAGDNDSYIHIHRAFWPLLDGDGHGDGDGDGYGDGDGDGDGDGHGDGDGDGYGYGDGDRNGDGYGYGNGDRNGDGYGDRYQTKHR